MELQGKLVTGVFRARPNRFLALVDIEKNLTVLCFVPNPGRIILLSSAFIHLSPKIDVTNSVENASFGLISIPTKHKSN
ncbi:MAG: hypothetical protein HWN65_24160 [Candidatus Helarchaeota archaeon]|nr:hypothetical protein [Candidatus Helarchaeota archaeon]